MTRQQQMLNLMDRKKYPHRAESYKATLTASEKQKLAEWLEMKSERNNPNKLLDMQRAVLNWRYVTGNKIDSDKDTMADVEHFVKVLYNSKSSDEVKKSFGEFLFTGKRSFIKWKYPKEWPIKFNKFEDESENELIGWKVKPIDERLTENDLITSDEFERMWKFGVERPKERCLIKLHATCPGRTKEIRELTWANIDWDNKRIKVHDTKTDRPREMPIDDLAIEFLKKWKSEYYIRSIKKWNELNHHGEPKKNWFIFPSQNSPEEPMTGQAIWVIFKRAGKKAGISKNLYGYLTRHSVITHYQKKGMDSRDVMQIAGHSNINTTLRYTHLDKSHAINSVIQKVFNEEKLPEPKKHELEITIEAQGVKIEQAWQEIQRLKRKLQRAKQV